MAAATTTGLQKRSILGDQRYVGYDSIAFAANGDTWAVPGVGRINSIMLTPITNTAFGSTISANVITLVSGGALTFRGGVLGV